MENLPTKTPGEWADQLLVLAAESSRFGDELSEILMKKPGVWNEMRGNYKSDTSADRAFEATLEGLRETWLKLRIKSNDRLSSAIKTKLRIMSDEARNIY